MLVTLDHDLFLALNAPAGLTGFPLAAAIFAAKDLIYVVWLVLAGLWLWGEQVQRQAVLLAVISLAVALLASAIIGHLWFQPRPFMLGLGHNYLSHKANNSFPSDHATLLATVSFMLLWFRSTRIAGIFLLVVTLCVSWARIYVGVHFPVDMFGAYLLSLITVIVILTCQRPINQYLLPKIEYVYQKVFTLPIRWGWVKN